MLHPTPHVLLALVTFLAACGVPSDDRGTSPATTRSTHDTTTLTDPPVAANPLASEVTPDPKITGAWAGIRVLVSDHELHHQMAFEAEIGRATVLGDTGLTLTPETFLPDFVMNDGEIRSRSSQPHNPAALVSITEPGAPAYRGWMFAAMPGIPPYPHPEYRVVLLEGIPAESPAD